ncbi:MAG: queuosine precursor transporter [Treponema sp.]|nr:queuosine precursor transporter [Treponema sp.]
MVAPQPGENSYKYFDILMALFVAVLVLSNIASSAKIVDLGLSLRGIRLAFDGGTLLFPLAYVLGDILTEVYGFKASRRVIWTGFAILAFSSLVFFVLRVLPAENYWEASAGSAAYNAILGGMSSGGIVLASLAGYLVGEFFNSALLSRIKVLMKGRLLWFRAIISSLAGELLDSLIFVSIASLAGVFGWELFLALTLTNYILKCLIEALVLPVTYAAVRFLKKREGVDAYDVGVKYSPLSLSQNSVSFGKGS